MNESDIFNAAAKLPASARLAFLDQACGADRELRQNLDSLLAAHDEAGDFLQQPATQVFSPVSEGPGTVIGPYKLLQQIGEGGFGVVYMAEQQQPVRRKVALKIIKPGMDTREVVARFESERQALALMDHPNIARVFDAGATASGRPYFVMELVKGIPITDYCDKNNLSTEQRLELFVTVCHAVQHAHQKGIIHRDIKPTNVLVTLHDGKPVPKVIDFGVSKATSQQLTEKTLFTAFGQMIGTPAYMSPEQAEMSGLDIDTRSDIYSLGVLLYELLTGTTPFEGRRLRAAGYAEMQRIIREETPPRPSMRISTLGDSLTAVSSHRSIDPKRLSQLLRGDLDVIVMKALEKERGLRYGTPNAFAEDVDRYLRREAILARPASTAYRIRKFAQRNKAGVATAASVATLLIAGSLISTWLAIREYHASEKARVAQTDAENNLREVERQRNLAEAAQKQAVARETEASKARQSEAKERAAAEAERDKVKQLNAEVNDRKEQQRRMLYAAQLNLIQAAWDAGNIDRVNALLDATRPQPGETDLRGFEWHYWRRMCHQEESTIRLGVHVTRNPVARTAMFSADGRLFAAIVTHEEGEELKVWRTSESTACFSCPLESQFAALRKSSRTSGTSTNQSYYYAIAYVSVDRVAVYAVARTSNFGARVSDLDAKNKNGGDLSTNQDTPSDTELVDVFDTSGIGSAQLCTFDLNTKELSYQLATPITFMGNSPFGFSQDGSRVIARASRRLENSPRPFIENVALLWDGKTGEKLNEVSFPNASRSGFTINSDASRIATVVLQTRSRPPSREPSPTPADEQTGRPRSRIAIVDVATGATMYVGDASGFANPMFSSDGSLIAALSLDEVSLVTSCKVIEVATGREVRSFPTASTASTELQFSPDGRWLVDIGRGMVPATTAVTLWDVAEGRLQPRFLGHRGPLAAVGFSPDGQIIHSVDRNGELKSWRIAAQASTGVHPFRSIVALLGGSPNGRWTAFAAQSSADLIPRWAGPNASARPEEIEVVDNTGGIESNVVKLSGPAWFIAFSPDNELMAVAAVDPKAEPQEAGEIKVWHLASGELRFSRRLPKFSDPTATASSRSNRRRRPAYPDVSRLAFSADSRRLAFVADYHASAKPSLRLWNLKEDREEYVAELSSAAVGGIRFCPRGERLVVMHASQNDAAWERRFSFARGSVGPAVYYSGFEVRNAATGGLLWNIDKRVALITFSGDGRSIAATTSNADLSDGEHQSLVAWHADTGKQRGAIATPASEACYWIAVTHDGSRLAAVMHPPLAEYDERSGHVMVYDVDAGKELYTLRGLRGQVSGVAFSPDGQRIATSATSGPGTSSYLRDGETNLWNAADGQPLLALPGGPRWLAFSADELRADFSEFAGAASEARPGNRWSAAPLPVEIEADEIVERLATADTSVKLPEADDAETALRTPFSRDEIARRIADDLRLDTQVRAAAVSKAQSLRRDEKSLRDACLALCRLPGWPRECYERAVGLGKEATDASPDNREAWSYRGIAHYRLGQFDSAIECCQRSLQLRKEQQREPSAKDLLILAMAHFKRNERDTAQKFLAQGQARILSDAYSPSADRRQLWREAETLLGAQSGGSVKELWLGRRFLLRFEAVSTLGKLGLSPIDITKPFVVEKVEGNSLFVADRVVPKERVVPVERAHAYYDGLLAVSTGKTTMMFARYGRGVLYASQQDAGRAIDDLVRAATVDKGLLLDELIHENPQTATYIAARGATRIQNRDYTTGITDLTEAIRLQSGVAAFHALRASAHTSLGNVDAALADAERAVALSSDDVKSRINRGAVFVLQRNFTAAIADFSRAIELDPESANGYERRAGAHRGAGDLAAAIEDYSQAIRRDRDRASAYDGRGQAYFARRDYRRAHDDHRFATLLSPNTARYHYNLGMAAIELGWPTAALAMDAAIRCSPKNPRYRVGRGHALARSGDFSAAIEEFTKALELDSAYIPALMRRGEAKRRLSDLDGALADFSRVVEIDNGYPYAHALRGSIWREKGEYAKALADYDKAIELDPKWSRTYRSRAWLRATCPDAAFRDGPAAVADATRACEIEKWRNLDFISALAAAHAEAGDFDKAVERQQQALAKIGTTEKAEYERRLLMFRERKPLRDAPGADAEDRNSPGSADSAPSDAGGR